MNWTQNKNDWPVLFWRCGPLHGYLHTSILSRIFHQIVVFSGAHEIVEYWAFFCVVTLGEQAQPNQWRSSRSISSETPIQRLWCPYYLRAWHRLLRTLLPSIFMTGVHPPSPHPKSPMWQRTDVGFESKIIVTIWVLFVLDKEDTFWLINNCSETSIRRTLEHSLRVSKHAGFSLFT